MSFPASIPHLPSDRGGLAPGARRLRLSFLLKLIIDGWGTNLNDLTKNFKKVAKIENFSYLQRARQNRAAKKRAPRFERPLE
jgi:hypothetical protein